MNFLAPLGFALGALSLPILAMYFLKLRRKRIVVPSTLLWQVVQKSEQAARPFDRFRRNLLLLLQLLLLFAVMFALARPYLETEASTRASVVLLVDTSASMAATDVSIGTNRLDAAISGAREVLSDLGPGDEVMLVVAGPRTEVRVPFTRDANLIEAELDRLAVTGAEGSLRQGLQLALSMAKSRQDVSVVVLSDGGGEGLEDLPTGGTEIQYVPVGRTASNTGITAIDLRRSPANELDRQLFVTVQNFGGGDVAAEVKVFLDSKLVGLRNETVTSDEPLSLVFEIAGKSSGLLRVELDAEDDYLPADDVAFAVVGQVSKRKVLLVGGDWLTVKALAHDPRVELTAVGAGEFESAMLDEHDATLFATEPPAQAIGHHFAVLGPYPDSPVTFGAEYKVPRVLGWRRTHPVLRFVEWSGIRIARAHTVGDMGALIPIVDSDGGPLVLAGERGGARVVQLAFDPLESDMPLRVAWPVFLLNTVGWLTEDQEGGGGVQQLPAGTAWVRRLPDGVAPEDVRVTAPDGSAVDAQISGGLIRVRDTGQVGVYKVRAGGTTDRFTTNLMSVRESRIAPRSALSLSETQVEATQASLVGRQEIWRYILLFALFVLLVEWVVWNRRRIA